MARIAFLLAFLMASTAWGDVLLLKNGRQLEGKVTRKGDRYYVQMSSGISTSFPASQVKGVKKTLSTLKQLEQELEKLSAYDYHGRYALGKKARRKGLDKLATRLFQEVIQIKPNHYKARMELGYVRYRGQWVQKKKFMKKIGFTRHKNRWVTNGEKKSQMARDKENALVKELTQKVRKTIYLGTKSQRQELDKSLESKYGAKFLTQAYPRLLEDSASKVRLFAAKMLGKRKMKLARPRLVKTMLRDSAGKVRAQAYRSLKLLDGPPKETHSYIVQNLSHKTMATRFAALGAVHAFQIKAAIPALVGRLNSLGVGLSRQHVQIVTQRAYIRNWTLGSAGPSSGSGIDIPDPEIATFFEGMVMETSIVKIEYIRVQKVLSRLRR